MKIIGIVLVVSGLANMINTEEYYGGKMPEPHEIIEDDDEYDLGWDLDYADFMHDREILGDN